MQIGMIGLGRMGGNMTTRLEQHGHQVVAYDRSDQAVQEAAGHGAEPAHSLQELVQKLHPPRGVWIMVPAGKPVDDTIDQLIQLLSPGDTIIDGGNSKWTDSIRRARQVESHQLQWLDVGTSGGIWGLSVGYSMMIGGYPQTFQHWQPIFEALAPKDGYGLVGPPGSGHFVKMVHNGIEYGMMEAYAEGFEILKKSNDYPNLDLTQISGIWNHGSVIRSWLLELAEAAFKNNPGLEGIAPYVQESGEGRWTVEAAIDEKVPAPVIAESLFRRFASLEQESFSDKVLAALRNEFGGHAIKHESVTAGGSGE